MPQPTEHPALRMHATVPGFGVTESPQLLRRLVSQLKLQSTPASTAIPLLAMLYRHLDPSNIPPLEQLDEAEPLDSVLRAVPSLTGIAFITLFDFFPGEAANDIWNHVWPWLEFLHAYRSSIDWGDAIDGVKYAVWASLLARLLQNIPAATGRQLVTQTGVQTFCTRSWMLLLDLPEAQRDTTYATAGFFHLLHAEDPMSFRAIVEEAGGTLNDLAVLVVKHFRHAIPRRTAHYPFFAFIAPFLKEIRDEAEIPFDEALRANGFVGALVLAMLELGDGLHSGVPALRSTLLTQLERCLIPPPGYVALTEALDAGLLPLLIICARFPSHGRTGDKLQALITMVSHGTVFYPVMSRLAQYVDYADPLTQDPTFQRSSSYAAWKHFRGLYEERLVVLRQFDARSSASLKACDKLECDSGAALKIEFKRCAVCQTAYYCSRECQTVDWRIGHRVACPHLRALRLAEPPLSPRARAFMRTLVHHEYIANQADLVRRKMDFRSANPDTDYYIAFDHVETGDGTMLLGVQAIPDVEDLWRLSSRARSDWAVVWKEAVARFRRSRGTLELHLLVVKEGWETRMRLFPMRTISARSGVPELEDSIQTH